MSTILPSNLLMQLFIASSISNDPSVFFLLISYSFMKLLLIRLVNFRHIFEPLNDNQIQHLFSDGICSAFLALLNTRLTPSSDLTLHDHFLPDLFSHRRLVLVRNFVHFLGHFDYQFLSKIPIVSFPLLWSTIYNEFYTALSKSDKQEKEDIAYWLIMLGYIDPSQCIAFE